MDLNFDTRDGLQPMTAQWFYRQGTEEIGPVNGNEIRSLAKAGTIVPSTVMRKLGGATWIRAARIKRLFDGVETAERIAELEGQDDEGPGPLVALMSRAASLVASAAGSTASAIGGLFAGWLTPQKERDTELVKPPNPTPAAVRPPLRKTDTMSPELSRELTNGFARGINPREMARNIGKNVEGFAGTEGKTRAMTIARTETIRSLAERQLDEIEALGVVGVAVEWSTSENGEVCKLCAPLNGIVLTVAEARGLIPRHPGCSCCGTPANVGEDKTGQKRSKTAIDKAIDKSITAEIPRNNNRTLAAQKEGTSWAGVHKAIAKKRPKSVLD